MLVWNYYISDLGRSYPKLAVAARQINEISTQLNPLDLLPLIDRASIAEAKFACPVTGLTPRKIRIFAADRGEFEFDYYRPFDAVIYDHLSSNIAILGFEFEFIGEKIKHYRVAKLFTYLDG